ncbi:hypothetical protein UA08_09405 [Talaromyces atroroseus]|uniref:FAD dependent oxidoreductase domain-containing protein n=1 Tax=Talaromyces atroroseus TaxID=1441469 RepID=A0A1Q5Q6I9_TALAT|nr:hypothetical protein UA08_09405 [Talaromyces atroroseus]OKL55360.1 hypothetical protein UA08_09405 [Talaromyces atroroseus]
MTKPSINNVAVIGAGISGVVTAAHLLSAGLEVTVFERNREAGGVWLYDDRRPVEPIYPSTKASQGEQPGDYEDLQESERIHLEHAPPGACYVGLQNNVSTPLMKVTLNSWPDETPDFVSHRVMNEYIQDTSRKTGVDDITKYGVKVVDVQKVNSQSKWRVTWTKIYEDGVSGRLREQQEDALFDAVVVASGHYHAPRVPDLPGLSEIKRLWPQKNVFLIGGGVSSTDIARELGPVAKSIYQSTRNGPFDLAASLLPENGVRVDEVASFELSDVSSTAGNSTEERSLPVTVHLKSANGHYSITDIDYIIICTGYHITLPFLGALHEDETIPTEASDTVLVTDGRQIHNLHKDIFYITDPTLSFIGVPFYTATFSLFDFQAITLAAVYSGVAQLPPESNMREEYLAKVEKKGIGRHFHSLKDQEEIYVKDLLDWVNSFRGKYGLPLIEGHTETWLRAKEEQRKRMQKLFATYE